MTHDLQSPTLQPHPAFSVASFHAVLSICLHICLSIYLPTYLSIYLFLSYLIQSNPIQPNLIYLSISISTPQSAAPATLQGPQYCAYH